MSRPQKKNARLDNKKQRNELAISADIKKQLTFRSGKEVNATRIVVSANELESKTIIHKLNPRRQESLSPDSVRDIINSIEKEGVQTEGVAIKNWQGVYELLDSSRRRFSCLIAKKNLPLWVIEDDISEDDLKCFIQTTQSVKRLSYRELGFGYEKIMEDRGFTNIDELSEYLSIGRETCRKRYVAASINQDLISIFPDCEGLPNGYYAKLSRIEKRLNEVNMPISDFISLFEQTDNENDSIEDRQKNILKQMEEQENKLKIKQKKPSKKVTWNATPIAKFTDKNRYAKVLKSSDGRGMKIEFSRLSTEFYDDVIKYITEKTKAEEVKNL